MRTYAELSRLHTLEDRFQYLSLGGAVGTETFGFDRWMNQMFYRSKEWRDIRSEVAVRDNGFDLGVPDFRIRGDIYVHHMNPLTAQDIEESTDNLLNPEFLISCSLRTHNAIHYGDKSLLPQEFVERSAGDTRLWGR